MKGARRTRNGRGPAHRPESAAHSGRSSDLLGQGGTGRYPRNPGQALPARTAGYRRTGCTSIIGAAVVKRRFDHRPVPGAHRRGGRGPAARSMPARRTRNGRRPAHRPESAAHSGRSSDLLGQGGTGPPYPRNPGQALPARTAGYRRSRSSACSRRKAASSRRTASMLFMCSGFSRPNASPGRGHTPYRALYSIRAPDEHHMKPTAAKIRRPMMIAMRTA